MRAVVILSGGIDSTTALFWANKTYRTSEVVALFFQYGQKHGKMEFDCAIEQSRYLRIPLEYIGLSDLKLPFNSALTDSRKEVPTITEVLGHPQPSTYVPFRNQLMLTIACSYCEGLGGDTVVYGAQLHDMYGYWDATKEFVERFNNLISLNRLHKIQIVAPLVGMKKGDVLKLGYELGVDFSKTYSCYQGLEYHCGVCPTCAERKKGFIDAGLVDPTKYFVGDR